MRILSLKTDSYFLEGSDMTVAIISRSISMKVRDRAAIKLGTPATLPFFTVAAYLTVFCCRKIAANFTVFCCSKISANFTDLFYSMILTVSSFAFCFVKIRLAHNQSRSVSKTS